MLKENQFVTVKWNPYSQKYYQSKGYVFTKRGDEFQVKIEDLQEGSHTKVKVICDFCGEEYTKIYKDYFAQHKNGDCCKKCQGKKSLKTTEQKYGVGFRGKKLKEIAQERYSVDNIAKSKEISDRIKNTNLEKYGATTCLTLPENREKMLQSFKNPEIMEKRIATNLAKYGTKFGLSSPEVRSKIINTLRKNNTAPTSSQQLEIYNILLEKFPTAQLNYPCGSCMLDCSVEINGVKIDVEYDGRYWHQDEQRDRRRDEFVKTQGYKILRIRGSHAVPTIGELMDRINFLLTTIHTYTCIELD